MSRHLSRFLLASMAASVALLAGPAHAAEAALPVALLSRLHIPLLHFPIGLLTVALAVELVLRKRGKASEGGGREAVSVLLLVSALSAVVVVASGLATESVEEFHGRAGVLVERHEVLGIVTALLAVVSFVAHRATGAIHKAALPALVLASLGSVVTGHLGGSLVHGEDYYAEAFDLAGKGKDTAVAVAAKGADDDDGPRVASDGDEGSGEARFRHPEGAIPDKPDYAQHIRPIFDRSCVKCHGPEKRKSGLRLDTKRFAMKGGDSGLAIAPGDPSKSLLYTMSALDSDDEDVMPTKGKLLALSEIETLKRWIEQGAVWPGE